MLSREIQDVKLTDEEDKLTKYCIDFCPIYHSIEEYNSHPYNREHHIMCTSEMCDVMQRTYILNRREHESKTRKETA